MPDVGDAPSRRAAPRALRRLCGAARRGGQPPPTPGILGAAVRGARLDARETESIDPISLDGREMESTPSLSTRDGIGIDPISLDSGDGVDLIRIDPVAGKGLFAVRCGRMHRVARRCAEWGGAGRGRAGRGGSGRDGARVGVHSQQISERSAARICWGRVGGVWGACGGVGDVRGNFHALARSRAQQVAAAQCAGARLAPKALARPSPRGASLHSGCIVSRREVARPSCSGPPLQRAASSCTSGPA